MSLTYAIPDIHGRIDLLELAVDKIVEHSAGERATIVILGDYVDHGPSSRQVTERLRAWRSDKLTVVNLKGNHEEMLWEACNNPAKLSWWIMNGGDQTLARAAPWPLPPTRRNRRRSAGRKFPARRPRTGFARFIMPVFASV